jgi:hypothetical protein
MSKYCLLICLLSCFAICCTNKNRLPSGILNPEEMQGVLSDMIQADQYSSLYLRKDSARVDVKLETEKLYGDVFRIHHITPQQFRESYHFYLSRPDITKVVFDTLVNRANRSRSTTTIPTFTPPKKLK